MKCRIDRILDIPIESTVVILSGGVTPASAKRCCRTASVWMSSVLVRGRIDSMEAKWLTAPCASGNIVFARSGCDETAINPRGKKKDVRREGPEKGDDRREKMQC